MCNKEEVMTMIELAKKLEFSQPKEAARQYFLAAEALVQGAKENPKEEQKYLELAQRSFLRGRELKAKPAEIRKVTKSNGKTNFDSIGGLEDLKQEIRMKIIEPFKRPDLFRFYGKQAGGGILMYGPPGCGKSLIAKATANEAGANFIQVKSSDLKSKFVGETEKNIAELFESAREKQPTIIFFDEFEALGGDRTDAPAHDKSAVAQLLTEMDGMDTKDQQILLLAATNEPWSVDPALRREGRFGVNLFVPPPDEEARREILQLHLANRPTEELDYDELADITEGFSGADLKAVCEMATDIPLKESLNTGKKRLITQDDMNSAVKNTKSVLKQWFGKALEQVKRRKLEEDFSELVKEARKEEKAGCN
ncbi:ATP-binding protein [Candidatus Woesearchaeota archaeon]|nr:ATP-binding protein [Candidatus Woesearchaeota archaeon]